MVENRRIEPDRSGFPLQKPALPPVYEEDFHKTDEITRQAVNFVRFMQKRGYVIYPDFYGKFFSVMATTGLKFEDAEPALKTLVAKNQDEESSFLFDFQDFIHNRKDVSSKSIAQNHTEKKALFSKNEAFLKETEASIEKEEKKIESLKKKLDSGGMDPKDIKYLKGKKNKAADIDSICKKCGLERIEQDLISGIYDTAKMKEKIRKATAESVYSENFKDAMDYFKRAYKIVDKKEKSEFDTVNAEIQRRQGNIRMMKSEAEYLKKQRDLLKEELAAVNDRLIQKLEAVSHREKFLPGGSVQAQRIPELEEKDLNVEFSMLQADQREKIKNYIRENARTFRTRFSRNVHCSAKRKINLPETCKKACATNGIPIKLCYEKPVRSKAKLLMFLDISGSCREASEFMLYFMFCMKDVFPAGCKCYVFVNRLFDISEFFDTNDPDAAVRAVLTNIQTKGVYSDYGTPFSEFYEQHQVEVTKDSIVFFIGDARNNKRASGEQYIKYIGRKCRNAYWFNTEARSEWDNGDSIISTYSPYMEHVDPVVTANELIRSLMMVK